MSVTLYDRYVTHQNRATGGGLQAGQAAGQQSSVAALGVVFQSDAVGLWVLHDQTRVLRLRQAGVQFTSPRIHEVGPRTGDGLLLASRAAVRQRRRTCESTAGYCYLRLAGASMLAKG